MCKKLFGLAILATILTGCALAPKSAVTLVIAPEVSGAASIKSLAIAPFSAPSRRASESATIFNTQLRKTLTNISVEGQPFYEIASSTTLNQALRQLKLTHTQLNTLDNAIIVSKHLNVDGLITGEILIASVNQRRYKGKERYCKRYEEKKKSFLKYKSCKEHGEKNVICTERTATYEIQPRLIDIRKRKIIFSKNIRETYKQKACGSEQIDSNQQLLTQARKLTINKLRQRISPYEQTAEVTLLRSTKNLSHKRVKAQFKSALAFAKAGRHDRACNVWRQLEANEKQSVSLLHNLGVCMERQGRIEQANLYYRQADAILTKPIKKVSEALDRSKTQLRARNVLSTHRQGLFNKVSTTPLKPTISSALPNTTRFATKNKVALISNLKPVSAPKTNELTLMRAEKRNALVIGNARYEYASPLANPVNDANDITDALRALDFEVFQINNADYRQMHQQVERFGTQIAAGGIALVYYAGHGVQVRGDNYL